MHFHPSPVRDGEAMVSSSQFLGAMVGHAQSSYQCLAILKILAAGASNIAVSVFTTHSVLVKTKAVLEDGELVVGEFHGVLQVERQSQRAAKPETGG